LYQQIIFICVAQEAKRRAESDEERRKADDRIRELEATMRMEREAAEKAAQEQVRNQN
jgi:hypothetical protein